MDNIPEKAKPNLWAPVVRNVYTNIERMAVARRLTHYQIEWAGVEMQVHDDYILDALVYELKARLHSRDISEHTTSDVKRSVVANIPSTWWDHLKETLLLWGIRRGIKLPWLSFRQREIVAATQITHTTIRRHLCPHLPSSERHKHLGFLASDLTPAAS